MSTEEPKGRTQAAQPVRFSGEQWRNWVPVRPPWTKRITERVPHGSTAVLLNPLHRHTDIYLPVDAEKDRLFTQIDGDRTFGYIARKNASEKCALPFFEKLWRYDQIVIDARGSN